MSSSPPPSPAREVRVTDYARRAARRWYVIVVAVVVAVGLVFLHAVSGSRNQSTATASVYLGQPLGPGGSSVITNTPLTNPQIAVTYVKSTSTLAQAAKAAQLTASKLKSHVSVLATNPSTGGTAGSQNKSSSGAATISITVEGPWSRQRVQAAAERLATLLITYENRYTKIKKSQLGDRIAAEKTEISGLQATVDRATNALKAIDSSGLSAVDKATTSAAWGQVLGTATQQLGDVSTQLSDDQIEIAAVDSIESSQFISHATGRQVSAIKRRSSIIVAAFIGLVVGVALALLWDAARARRATAAA